MACSGVISWDDDAMNLDLLFGEYTDCENEEKQTKSSDKASVIYNCPKCSKTFKSISGFRVHVTEKHGINVKASAYRQEQHSGKQSREEPVITKLMSDWIPPNVYEDIFDTAFHNTAKDIQTNPIHNLFGRSTMSYIAEFTETYEPFRMQIKELFAKLAKDQANILLCMDRENLYRKFHALRLSSDMKHIKDILCESVCPCRDDISNFLQVFILEMTSSILSTLAKTMKNKSVKEVDALSDNDQKVIFYISGYIIHALKKTYSKIQHEQNRVSLLNAVDSLISPTCNGQFSLQYASLLAEKNRGLKHPCDDLFSLVRSLETVVRRKTSDKLQRCEMVEELMENYMTKYYCEEMFSFSEDDSFLINSRILEDIVNSFLTIRGAAAALV